MSKKKVKKTVKAKAKPAKKAKASKPAVKAPKKPLRQPALPGTEQIRNKSLDRICEGISDVRQDTSRLRGEEQDLTRQAVSVMQRDKVTAYRSAGVELVLVPGDVKLRVRTLKDTANADAIEELPEESGDDAPLTAEELGGAAEELGDAIQDAEGDEQD